MQSLSVMLKGYESAVGIFDHFEYEASISETGNLKSERVLLGAAMHPSENLEDEDPFFERLQQYRYKNVKEIFNLTITEFFNLPRSVVERILKECDLANTQTSKQVGDINNSLKKELGN